MMLQAMAPKKRENEVASEVEVASEGTVKRVKRTQVTENWGTLVCSACMQLATEERFKMMKDTDETPEDICPWLREPKKFVVREGRGACGVCGACVRWQIHEEAVRNALPGCSTD